MQTQIAILGEAGKVQLADSDLIRRCPDAHQAMLLQLNLSGMTDESLGDLLGITKGHFSRMRSGSAHFPTRKLATAQSICRNAALAQFLAYSAGFDLVERDLLRERAERAEARLRALGEAV